MRFMFCWFCIQHHQVWAQLCWHLCSRARSGVISSLLASLFASKIRCDLIFVGIFVRKQHQVWAHLCWLSCPRSFLWWSGSNYHRRRRAETKEIICDNILLRRKTQIYIYSSPVISKWLQIWQNKYHQTNSPQIVLLLKIGLICPCKSRHRSSSVKMQHFSCLVFLLPEAQCFCIYHCLLSFPPSWRTSVRSLRSVPSSWGQATKCPLKRTGVRNIFSLKKSFLTYIQVLSSSIGTGIAVRPAMES